MKKRVAFLPLLLLLSVVFFSCDRENFLTDPSAKLSFSTDTVTFDTVFTTIGSTTQRLKVFNPHKQPIKASRVYLKGGRSSNFRINIDGISATSVEDLEIREEDSLYIFVEVTVDPNNGTLPLIIEDQIIFETNGNVQDVDLVAWGQDAYFYNFALFGDFTLPVDKPSVFFGFSVVDSAATLTIPAGAQLHFHKGAGLIVGSEGALKVQGTFDEPVVFQGDRLEEAYNDIPGQWGTLISGIPFGGIWLTKFSRQSEIDYAIIRNGDIGIQVDSLSSAGDPKLLLTNTVIENMSSVGLFAQGASVEADNCVFTNCGQYTAALYIGGRYRFRHCTFANYWRFGNRTNGMLLLNDYFEDANGDIQFRELEQADFINCIVFGSKEEEITLDEETEGSLAYFFDHCLVRTELETNDADHFTNIIANPGSLFIDGLFRNPVFNDVNEGDYKLFEQSAAIGGGKENVLPEDIEGNMRDATNPDLGAYKYIPE